MSAACGKTTIWGRRSSFNVQKVLWLAEELGLDYEHVPAGGQFGQLDTPAFLAMNPHGKVPVLRDDDVTVWESHAILRYLAARHGGPAFWPVQPAARARADGWMDWAQTALQPAFLVGVFWGYYRTPEAQRDTAAVARNLDATHACLRKLDEALTDQPYLSERRGFGPGGPARRDVALPLLRTGYPASAVGARARLVRPASSAAGVSPACDGAVRRVTWPAGFLTGRVG